MRTVECLTAVLSSVVSRVPKGETPRAPGQRVSLEARRALFDLAHLKLPKCRPTGSECFADSVGVEANSSSPLDCAVCLEKTFGQ
jgi:hypothetical protein